MWIIISIILGIITLLLLISNSVKNDRIAMLQYTILQMANDDKDIKKAAEEYERFKQ